MWFCLAGSRELTGAEDLIAHYGLQELYEQFCKKPLSVPISDSTYLQHVVGDIEIRKGEGMEFGQLIAAPAPRAADVEIQPLDLQLLQWAFTLKENGAISLQEVRFCRNRITKACRSVDIEFLIFFPSENFQTFPMRRAEFRL